MVIKKDNEDLDSKKITTKVDKDKEIKNNEEKIVNQDKAFENNK